METLERIPTCVKRVKRYERQMRTKLEMLFALFLTKWWRTQSTRMRTCSV